MSSACQHKWRDASIKRGIAVAHVERHQLSTPCPEVVLHPGTTTVYVSTGQRWLVPQQSVGQYRTAHSRHVGA
eukprot:3399434-Rhodomonas_salina.2